VRRQCACLSRHRFVSYQCVASGKALKATPYQRALPKSRSGAVTPTIKYLVKIVPDMHRVCRSPDTGIPIAKRNVDGLSAHTSQITRGPPKCKVRALERCYLIPDNSNHVAIAGQRRCRDPVRHENRRRQDLRSLPRDGVHFRRVQYPWRFNGALGLRLKGLSFWLNPSGERSTVNDFSQHPILFGYPEPSFLCVNIRGV